MQRAPEPYDYSRRTGVEEVDWERFGALAATLTELLAGHRPDMVVGIARAGLIPAAAVAAASRLDLTPVRVSRREADVVVRAHLEWKVDVSADVQGRVVAVVDEMADTGETLALVAERCREAGAARVVTAALVAHSWADPFPDAVALVSDALVVFPWDRRVFSEGRLMLHPELVDALGAQGVEPEP